MSAEAKRLQPMVVRGSDAQLPPLLRWLSWQLFIFGRCHMTAVGRDAKGARQDLDRVGRVGARWFVGVGDAVVVVLEGVMRPWRVMRSVNSDSVTAGRSFARLNWHRRTIRSLRYRPARRACRRWHGRVALAVTESPLSRGFALATVRPKTSRRHEPSNFRLLFPMQNTTGMAISRKQHHNSAYDASHNTG